MTREEIIKNSMTGEVDKFQDGVGGGSSFGVGIFDGEGSVPHYMQCLFDVIKNKNKLSIVHTKI